GGGIGRDLAEDGLAAQSPACFWTGHQGIGLDLATLPSPITALVAILPEIVLHVIEGMVAMASIAQFMLATAGMEIIDPGETFPFDEIVI
ncbi:MAG: hypothetical protein WB820_11260, partial [Rhodoplanes sp.]